ncbi:MAG: hypothetical protein Q4C60_01255 [Eubacteriales bacterium]|nr:hypothetical protein [Eubacteriales bacterium]
MKQMLKEYLGLDFEVQAITNKPSMPMYLSARDMELLSYEKIRFVLVYISASDRFSVAALKKHLEKYEESFSCHVAFAFDAITQQQYTALLKAQIPFVALPLQIYLPFLGIMLRDSFIKTKKVQTEAMMPATQQLFLYMLYRESGNPVSKTVAAEALGLTKTSITRASDQLRAMKLITEERAGTALYMNRTASGREYYEMAKPYLINPVKRKMMIREQELPAGCLLAGETALSQSTMLNPPRIVTKAIYKGNPAVKMLHPTDERWDQEPVINLELWKYDPKRFSRDKNMVDPISLICSLADIDDERVEMCMEERLEKMQW